MNNISICRDAAALSQFWAWLEEEISKNAVLTEVDVADKLLEFREQQYGFLDTSFDTISGKYKSHFFVMFLSSHGEGQEEYITT